MQRLHKDVEDSEKVEEREKMVSVRTLWVALEHGCTFGYSPTGREEDRRVMKIPLGAGLIMSPWATPHFGTSCPKMRVMLNYITQRDFGGRKVM